MVQSIDISPPGSNIGQYPSLHYAFCYNPDTRTSLFSVSPSVPLLRVTLINGSPRVVGDSVEAEFETSRPVTGVRCFLRSQTDRTYTDCESY